MRLSKSWVEKVISFIWIIQQLPTDSKCWCVLAHHVKRLNSLALSLFSEGDKFLFAMDLRINFSYDFSKLLSANMSNWTEIISKRKWALCVYTFWTRFFKSIQFILKIKFRPLKSTVKHLFFHLVHTAQVNSRPLTYGPHGKLPHLPSTK